MYVQAYNIVPHGLSEKLRANVVLLQFSRTEVVVVVINFILFTELIWLYRVSP